ncbi:MarR family transcriptional regulator [Streptomyces albus]|uniref:MarR family winged helix-turn-helix transcriptional regulator n=1 Tax=Streptomyces albus TaxID=1888 RepID=UPI003406D827
MADGPLRVGEIAQRMQTAGPHATRLVKELERRRLVHRVTDPHDRRASLIELTEPGASAVTTYGPSSAGSPKRSPTGTNGTAGTSAACWPASWTTSPRGSPRPTRRNPDGRADGAGVTTAGARVRGPGPADHPPAERWPRHPPGRTTPPGRPMHTAPGRVRTEHAPAPLR